MPASKQNKIIKKVLKSRRPQLLHREKKPSEEEKEESSRKKKELSRSEQIYVKKQIRVLKAGEKKDFKKNMQKDQTNKKSVYKDIWAENPKASTKSESEFLPKPTKIQVPKTLRVSPKAKVYQPAVDPGHPGSSYQPSSQDHRMLLNQVLKRPAKRRTLIAKIEKKKSTPKSLNKRIKKSKSSVPQGIITTVHESNVSDMNEEVPSSEISEEKVSYVPLPTPRVTHKERLKRKRRLLAKRNMLLARKKKRRFDPTIIKKKLEEVELQSLKQKLRMARRSNSRLQRKLLPQRLSKHKFKPMCPEVLVPSEIPSNLRTLRPTGNLFKDRFESLLKRNIIEPRVRVGKKTKKALITFQKASYGGF
ncbi:Glioma tumor suppressor candidate region protein 2 [Coelomomyces lativittatus]|nr:Glioma tumor suppressor candidate region protein 2 [Coelomomyces lativittatus]